MDETKLTKKDKKEIEDSAKELMIGMARKFIEFAEELIVKLENDED